MVDIILVNARFFFFFFFFFIIIIIIGNFMEINFVAENVVPIVPPKHGSVSGGWKPNGEWNHYATNTFQSGK